MKKLLLAIALLFAVNAADAQIDRAQAQNPTCPTRPFGDNSNACASTAFVQNALSGLIAAENPIKDTFSAGVHTLGLIRGMAIPSLTLTPVAGVLNQAVQFDVTTGSWYITAGTPVAVGPIAGSICTSPLIIPGQPSSGVAPNQPPGTAINLCTTVDSAIDGFNALTSTILSNKPSTHGHYAAQFTGFAAGTSTGAGGLGATYYTELGTAVGHAVVGQVASSAVTSAEIGVFQAIIGQHGPTPRSVRYFYDIKSRGAGMTADYGIRLIGETIGGASSVLTASGTVLGVYTGTRVTGAWGIDFAPNPGTTDAVFSGGSFRGIGFTVDGIGITSADHFKAAVATTNPCTTTANCKGFQFQDSTMLAVSELIGGNAYHVIYGADNHRQIILGGSADRTNYYDNTAHQFRALDGASTFGSWTTAGLRVGVVGSSTNVPAVLFSGTTSGTLTLRGPAVAGANTLTLPAGTTDFTATGGASQVVKQTSAGGAFTVAQLAASDLSNGVTGSGSVVLATSPTLVTPNIGVATGTSLTLTLEDAVTAASTTIADIIHNSTGTPAAGFGATLRFGLESTTTTNRVAGLLNVTWTDATDATRTSRFEFQTILSGTTTTMATINNSGNNGAVSLLAANGGGTGIPALSPNIFGISGNYVFFNSPLGNAGATDNVSIFVGGNTVDPSNYYNNTTHVLRSRNGVTAFLTLSTGIASFNGYVKTATTTVASLPTCNAGAQGAHYFVTDSNAASYTAGIGAVVAAGGATAVPVTCDGTNWRIGANDNFPLRQRKYA